jgi:subtilase family serine protease
MLNSRQSWLIIGLGVALLFGSIRSSLAGGRQFLHGHIPEAVSHLQPVGRLSATQHLSLAIGLPLRNEAALDHLLQQIYDPTSPDYRHYLTPEQFAEQFGPSKQDYQTLIAFAEKNGLTVTGTYPNHTLLDVSGSVADIEQVFHVTMRVYQHPKEARTFYAPDVEPSLDLAVPVLHISGLDNFIQSRPMSLHAIPLDHLTRTVPALGSGPSGLYMGKDFRAAYAPGVSLNGTGQVVGLLELDGYYASDITAYETRAGLPNITLTNVLVDSFSGSPGGNNIEVALDIEMAIAMATNVSKVIVYEGPNPGNPVDILARMASDNLAKQISSSWLIGDDPNADVQYKNFSVQGQSFFQASGDNGAYYSGIAQWADDTNITLVGGTTLTNTGSGGAWSSESAWNWYITDPPYTNSTGGGINFNSIPIPSWQQGINMTTNKGSTTLRNVPDVALTADNIFVVADNGTNYLVGGTSAAAPLWAGFTALINQQAVATGHPTIGFINYAVYAIGKSTNYTADFHDITTGNNTNAISPNNYFAVPGYDLCTGWGTPTGTNLITALAGPLDALVITPASGFSANGLAGGPFSVTAQSFTLTNSGAASLNWSVINTSIWLNASPGSGTLTPGGPAATVTVSLNSAASNLLAGTYTANVWFTNLNNQVAQSRQFALLVGPLVQNGGFEAGTFTNWTQSGNTTYTSVTSGNSQFVHSGTYGAALGPSVTPGYLSQTLPTFAGQNYLLSLWLDNPTNSYGATPNQFLVQWNGTAIFNQTNMPFTAWTNLQFIVTATGSSTVLQFGFENTPYDLGLDDISVTPIPIPALQAATRTSSTFNLTWGTITGLVYQVQYKTNLLQTSWINLGKPLIATNGSLTLSDTNAIKSSPQRFYRLMVSP